MFKNVASQKIEVFAYDITTGGAKTGDAAQITAYVSKDYGSVTVLGDTSATEMDATNAKGWYLFDLTQGETNANCLLFTAKSSTANIQIAGQVIYTDPPNYTTAVIDSSGLIDANAVKIGPTGAGTAQTARDIGTSVLVSSGTGTGQLSLSSGVIAADVTKVNADATSAANLAKTTRAIARGTVGSASTTTSVITSAFTPAGIATDQFKGRIITFDADTTTTALRGQATDITGSTISATPVFTVTALTTAPASTDTFSVT